MVIFVSDIAIFVLKRDVKLQLTNYGHLCKNGCTDRDTIWVVGSDRPKESCVKSGSTGASSN